MKTNNMEVGQSAASSSHVNQVPVEIGDDAYDTHVMVSDPSINEKNFAGGAPAYEEAGSADIPRFSAPAVPPYSRLPIHLQKPIAIPAVEAVSNAPFLRAYPPELESYNLPRGSFLTFLDNLNQVVATSAPLQVLDAAGGTLRRVPILFPLHILGAAVSGLANLSHTGISKGRAERTLKQANKDIFGPRGLKVEIGKLDALAQISGIPILDTKGKATRLTAVAGAGLSALQPVTTGEWSNIDQVERQLKTFQPWIADLQIDPLPWTSKSRLTRYNTVMKKRDNKQQQHTTQERQRKLAALLNNYTTALRDIDAKEQQARNSIRDPEKLYAVLDGLAVDRDKMQKHFDGESMMVQEAYATGEDESHLRKILWLIIRDVGADSGA